MNSRVAIAAMILLTCSCKPKSASSLDDLATANSVKTGFFMPKTSYSYSLAAVRDAEKGCDLGFPGSQEEYDERLSRAIDKAELATPTDLRFRLSVTDSNEEVIFGRRGNESFRPLASVTCKGKVFYWSQPAQKVEGGVIATDIFIRHGAGVPAMAYVTKDGERSNMYVLRAPLNKEGLPEPILVPWTRHLDAGGNLLYRVGNTIISAATEMPALQFEQVGKRVWRLSGSYEDQDVKHGTYFWSDGKAFYSASSPSGPVVAWKPQDNDSMDRTGRTDKQVPAPLKALFASKQATPAVRGLDWYNLDKDVIQVYQFYRFGKDKPFAEADGLSLAGGEEDEASFYLFDTEAANYRQQSAGFGLQDANVPADTTVTTTAATIDPLVPDFSQEQAFGNVAVSDEPVTPLPEPQKQLGVMDFDESEAKTWQNTDLRPGTPILLPYSEGSTGGYPAVVLRSQMDMIPGKPGVFSSTYDKSMFTTTAMSPRDGEVFDISPTGQRSNYRPLTRFIDEAGVADSRRDELIAAGQAKSAESRSLGRIANADRKATDAYVETDVLMGTQRFVQNSAVDVMDYAKDKSGVTLTPGQETGYTMLGAQLRGKDAQATLEDGATTAAQQGVGIMVGGKTDESDALTGAAVSEAKFAANRNLMIMKLAESDGIPSSEAAAIVDRAQSAGRRDQIYDYVFGKSGTGKLVKTGTNILIKGARGLDDYGRAANKFYESNQAGADAAENFMNVNGTDQTISFLNQHGATLQYGIQRNKQAEQDAARYDYIKKNEAYLGAIANGEAPLGRHEPVYTLNTQFDRPEFSPFSGRSASGSQSGSGPSILFPNSRQPTLTREVPPSDGEMAAYFYGKQWKEANPGIRVPTPRFDASTGNFVFPRVRTVR